LTIGYNDNWSGEGGVVVYATYTSCTEMLGGGFSKIRQIAEGNQIREPISLVLYHEIAS